MPKASGYIFLDGREVCETKTCCHCGHIWQWVKGSGRLRGYCKGCDGITCGNAACDPCIPWQQKMDDAEKAAERFRLEL